MEDRSNPRLANAKSPYLAEAADQPVDWHPWGEEAFELAKKEGKPVLVDAGAVWCHWCHVMDHESYADPETAALINERFVPIKLDRDERPHVDRRLQRAVGAITGRGGWPLTAFLTPDGEVYYGGTYFPPTPQGGMPSLRQVLEHAASAYEQDPGKATEQAQRIREAVEGSTSLSPGEPRAELVLGAVDAALGAYDPVHGGFGRQPKFPHVGTIELLLGYALEHEDERATNALQAALHTLEAMGEGGVHDHLAGGMHRYATDAAWHVPHFEKMLYDNGPLLGAYARATCAARRQGQGERAARFEAVARGIRRFLVEVLEQPEGGFGGSQDADRRPDAHGPLTRDQLEDGKYFTWTLDELEAALEPAQAKLARLHFGVDEQGDMPEAPGENVLRIDAHPTEIAQALDRDLDAIEEELTQVRDQLAQARSEREAPFVDPTVYVDWNGLAIEGLLTLDALLEDPPARKAALKALDRILSVSWDPEEGFAHAISEQEARVTGLLEDHAHMLPALIEAAHATQEPRYLEHARSVADHVLDRFRRPDGAFTATAESDEPADVADQPTASAVGQLCLHLARLTRLTGEARYREAAETAIERVAGRAGSLGGVHGGTLHRAIQAMVHEPPHVVVVGETERATRLAEIARRATHPLRTLVQVHGPDQAGVPEQAQAAADAFEGGEAAIVCRGQRCEVANEPERLLELLGAYANP